MNTQQVAERLVQLCREGNYEQAQEELYAPDAVSIEMDGLPPGALGNARGLDAIREKGRKWQESIETIHGGSVGDPVVAGDWFSLPMAIDATTRAWAAWTCRRSASTGCAMARSCTNSSFTTSIDSSTMAEKSPAMRGFFVCVAMS